MSQSSETDTNVAPPDPQIGSIARERELLPLEFRRGKYVIGQTLGIAVVVR